MPHIFFGILLFDSKLVTGINEMGKTQGGDICYRGKKYCSINSNTDTGQMQKMQQ